ncbi:hypothetical protein OPT61_g5962 [Boeremia exigua]|uniref:Uncharacterized protein n=1 Tax=Boeremia exigua TaxID=749465 RepID=A0ACC2I8N2_9PLEO|nr:hypothetical protein OPT61_g5962 [Boeremia exigua]
MVAEYWPLQNPCWFNLSSRFRIVKETATGESFGRTILSGHRHAKDQTLRFAGEADLRAWPPEKDRHGIAVGTMDAKDAAEIGGGCAVGTQLPLI